MCTQSHGGQIKKLTKNGMAAATRLRAPMNGGSALERKWTDSQMRSDKPGLERFCEPFTERQKMCGQKESHTWDGQDQCHCRTEGRMSRSSIFDFLINLFDLSFQMLDG